MFGIEDKGILAAYVLCIGAAVLCVVYGILNRNKGDEEVKQGDVKWVAEEKKVDEKF